MCVVYESLLLFRMGLCEQRITVGVGRVTLLRSERRGEGAFKSSMCVRVCVRAITPLWSGSTLNSVGRSLSGPSSGAEEIVILYYIK